MKLPDAGASAVGAAAASCFILNSDNAPKAQPVPAGQLPATHLLHAALSFVWLGLVLGTARARQDEVVWPSTDVKWLAVGGGW